MRGHFSPMLSLVGRRGRLPALVAVSALVVVGMAPVADAASVTSAVFSGGAGTYTASSGTVYARQGAALTLTVQADSSTICVRVTTPSGSVDQSRTGTSPFSFTSGVAELTAGSGNGVVQVTSVVGFKNTNGKDHCTANQGETFTGQPFYVLDNTGPVLTPTVVPAPVNGWSNRDTTVSWTAADPAADTTFAGSGVAAQPTGSTTISQDGVFPLTAPTGVVDHVGNAATNAGGTVRIDKSAPTVTGTRTPSANAFGWNNAPVTVSFACVDNPATNASGLAAPGCPSATVVGSASDPSKDVTGASVTGSVSDVAGNQGSATVSGISVDTVNPLLSGAATTGANAAGWYKNNVTVHWTASDARAGVDPASVPGDSTISSEGSGLTAIASVRDKAGNTGSATSPAVNIDKTAPVTGIGGAPNSWTNSAVTVTLTPTDALSHVASTTYSVDGGPSQSGTSFALTTDGDHVITYSSVDKAGNVEATKTAHVKIDTTAPSISHSFAPTDYSDGAWTNAAVVTVTFTCSDGGSGVASCLPATSDVTSEGAAQQVTGVAKDNAGNTASDTATVSIDRTPPVVTAAKDRAPNGNTWYNDDVLVSFTCADQLTLSGVKSCPATQRLGQGGSQTASGTALDNAGNTTTATLGGINVDKTPPVLTGAATTGPNTAGWYDNSVQVRWTCSDPLSGIDGTCPSTSTVSGEGVNLGATASVADKAGNATTATISGLKVDTTAPVTTASASDPLATGWYANAAHITLAAHDNLSGIAATSYSVDGGSAKAYADPFDFSTPGVHTITFWSIDVAGNPEDASAAGHTLTIQVDGIKPTITGTSTPAPNPAGWNNSDVTVAFSCADAESGIASCVGGTTLTTDKANQTVTGTATDHGGNSDTATVGPINLDKTAPVVTGAATTQPNTQGWYNGDVAVHWSATDPTSGVDQSTLPADTVVTGEGGDLTAGPVTAQDVAGNLGSGSVDHLKIDRTAPMITGQATAPANTAGWYRGDVTIAWSCSDSGSGIGPSTCPPASTITGEGGNLNATASVSDLADNTSSRTVDGISIDRTAPSTQISAPTAWTNQDATVTLSPSDNLSGVASTYYTVDGGSVFAGTTATFTSEGVYNLSVWSVDVAGNVEVAKSVTVRIDKTAPTIDHAQAPIANDAGWNNTDVTITFTCADTGGSGLKSCTDPVTETHEGKAIPEPGIAWDNAGNSKGDPATVSIDKSKPTIAGAADRLPNVNTWYKSDVTVSFTCADQVGLSGVKSCPDPVVLKQGAHQSASGTVSDAADNTQSTSVDGINVDTSPPTLTGAPTTDPVSGQWYGGDVVVHWTCADQDNLSGIDGGCPADTIVDGEGSNLSASAQVSDKAGNSMSATVTGLHIDRTAPITTSSVPTPDSSNGWYKAGPTVTLNATDTASGVAATYYRVDAGTVQPYTGPFTEDLEGSHTVTFWSLDHVGNLEDSAGTGNSVTIRVDTTNPTVTGSRTPGANPLGWNNGPVVVTFACADGGSGLASGGCTEPTTVSKEGANQVVTGTASDNVGNTSSAAVGDINIDLTAPSLTGVATTQPNAADWYHGDVHVTWTCSDALSGIVDKVCPPESTVSGEGANLSAHASVSDEAGNVAQATVNGIRIDRTGPVTTVSAPSDWQTAGVALDVTAADNSSGVKSTYFTVDGGAPQMGNKITLTKDGVYALTFWSVDNADNEGAHGSATVRIDQTAPSITHTITPDPNVDLWNNTDATVHFICSDATSDIKSCTSDAVVTTEGSAQSFQGGAEDNAGNVASDTAVVNLDKTKPTITGSADRPTNGNGWYKADVTVSFACHDALSGVVACPTDTTLAEGANQSVTGTVSDRAGNSQSATVSGINVDKTAPTLKGEIVTTKSGGDFFNRDVTVHWTCADAGSGLAAPCPTDSVVSGAGSNLSATATVTDLAGNTTSTSVSGINIDRTAPVTTASAPDATSASGWYSAPVPVTLGATDNLSGPSATYYSVDAGAVVTYAAPFTVGKGIHTVTFWSKDVAGNVEDKSTVGHSLTLKVDNVPPIISGAATTSPNANGWYASTVTVHFTCSDAESAVATCPDDKTLSTEGAAQSVTGTATDVAGNSASVTVGPINIDLTKPTFTAYAGPTSFTVGQTVSAPTCGSRAGDALSGLAGCELTSKGGSGFTNANGVGDFSYTFTARDKAGNAATQTLTLHVGYAWSGFLQPVTNTAHDLTTASTFKAGSTVPMKFVLKDISGTVKSSTYAPVWLQPVDLGTTTAGAGIASGDAGTVGGSFKGDGSGQYVFTWQTPKTGAGHYYRVGVQLDSGDAYTTLIKLS
jgi:uncharacterized protein YjbJ (UPF0337 family)